MTPLVLLPGMMCDERLFSYQIRGLRDISDVIVLPIKDHDTVAGLARNVLSSAPETFALAGLSMGGIVAMEVLRQAPNRVTRLALLDTNPKAETAKIAARRLPQIEKAKAGQLTAVMRDEMKPNYLMDGPHRAEILDLCMDMALSLGPEVFIRQSHALMTRPDQQDTLRACTVPTLILCGRDDALCPVHRHEMMNDLIPHSRLHVIEDAGHLPTLERPQETTAALRRWLETP